MESLREASSILIKKVAYQIPLPHTDTSKERADHGTQEMKHNECSVDGIYSPINEEGHNREHYQHRAQDDAEDRVARQRCNHVKSENRG
jgi:hypothetical protein